MLTGVREAVRALRMLKGASEEEANAAAGAVDGGLPSRKRKQVSLCVVTWMTTLLTCWTALFTGHALFCYVSCVTALHTLHSPCYRPGVVLLHESQSCYPVVQTLLPCCTALVTYNPCYPVVHVTALLHDMQNSLHVIQLWMHLR